LIVGEEIYIGVTKTTKVGETRITMVAEKDIDIKINVEIERDELGLPQDGGRRWWKRRESVAMVYEP